MENRKVGRPLAWLAAIILAAWAVGMLAMCGAPGV
jgi:hypothetical protein